MDFAAVAKIIGTVAGIVSSLRRDDGLDAASFRLQLQVVLDAIRDVRDDILAALLATELRELRSNTEALLETLRSYDPVPEDEPRLRNAIDRAAEVSRSLHNVIWELDPRSTPARNAIWSYILVVWLRTLAMFEREVRFGVPEIADTRRMLGEALETIGRSLVGWDAWNENRFACPVSKREGDTVTYGYLLDGEFVAVESIIDEPIERGIHQDPGPAREAARAACERRKIEERAEKVELQGVEARIRALLDAIPA